MKNLSEKIFYNALSTALFANYKKIDALEKEYKSYEKAFLSLEKKYEQDPEKLWNELERQQIQLLFPQDSQFPQKLKEIPWPPKAIYLKGSLPRVKKSLAIVGTRKASTLGLKFSRETAKELSLRGALVISGLALGLDSSAHKGALDAGAPTVAVLARGLDQVYPASNRNLAENILKASGALISEYPIGQAPHKNFFIERNRLISGLSEAVLVIEAPEKSGALSTARFAVEQNKDLFVLPGAINHPNYFGSNKLIQDGAILVQRIREILPHLGIAENKGLFNQQKFDKLDKKARIIVNALRENPQGLSGDELIQISELSPKTLQAISTELLIDGMITESGNKFILL